MSSGKDVIIGEISTSMSKLLGPSSAAMMRKAGMAASNRIWPELPTGKTFEEAGEIMSSAIDDLGGFGHFRVTGVVDGVAQIEFENCFFASFTAASGKPCGEQAICHFGFGLVEETLHRLTGIKTKVELTNRDDVKGLCCETATPR
jgi:predicted hydrocarbon binding protein